MVRFARLRPVVAPVAARSATWQRNFSLFACLIAVAVGSAVVGCNRKSAKSTGDPDNGRSTRVRLPDVDPVNENRPVGQLDLQESIQCLGHSDWRKRLQAANSLIEQGRDAIPALIAALDDENYHVRAGAAFALGKFGPAANAAAEKLQELAEEDERDAVRSAAAFAHQALTDD